MICPTCRRFTPSGVSRCPACGTVYAAAGQPAGSAATPTTAAPARRANASLRSAAAAALVNYVATRAQNAVQGYLPTGAPAPQPAQQSAALPPAPLPQVLPEGMTLRDGRFYLGPLLGRGCFGTTYRAVDQQLGRLVAIKEFFPEGSVRQGQTIVPPASLGRDGYEQERGHFIQEARILAQFKRPGIVSVYEVFEENDTAYMVMEYIAGRTLAEALRDQGGPLSPGPAVRYILAVADALAAVHEQHLLHRDVKPGNIMLTQTDDAVLIDFGAARRYDRYQRTSVMTAIGTPGYAPLEQWGSSGRFGPTSDVYALAATLYHLLTGKMPASAADRAIDDMLEPPHRLNAAVSPALSVAVVRGMAVRMDERPQTMADFAAALRAARSASPANSGRPRTGSGAGPASSANSGHAAGAGTPAQPPPRRASGATAGSAPSRAATARPTQAEVKGYQAAPAPQPDQQHANAATRREERRLEREQRRAAREAAPPPRPVAEVIPALPPPLPAPRPAGLPQLEWSRRLPRPLPQNARELLLYAVATPAAAVLLAFSMVALVAGAPLFAVAAATSTGRTHRVARRALKRSVRLGSRGVVLGAVCVGSLVVVSVAVGAGVVLVPLYALTAGSRGRRRLHRHARP